MGPEIGILRPLQRLPSVPYGNYRLQLAPGCDHSLHAAAHDMESKPFNSEEARGQRCIHAGQFVSFCLVPMT